MLVCSSARRPASLRVLLREASKALVVVRFRGLRGVVSGSIFGNGGVGFLVGVEVGVWYGVALWRVGHGRLVRGGIVSIYV